MGVSSGLPLNMSSVGHATHLVQGPAVTNCEAHASENYDFECKGLLRGVGFALLYQAGVGLALYGFSRLFQF